MRLMTMLSDVIRAVFQRSATRLYPVQGTIIPERSRGRLEWHPQDCTGCALCVKDCPANALELIVIDKSQKRFLMRYHADRCTYCGQCVESCRFKCLEMCGGDWELATSDKADLEITYGEPEQKA
ncbi:MAG: 4Fe-4S dicluster domain-containing protein [Anaerolinea sp.]|nr:4Fe-4S dicluster domain-containing protein [Anaerolinea sp.]MCC6973408.1 4Fe-4S dicluster domain-containing protein [Anaerolineae bacterium]CAG1010840.1 NADH-quinone oxidoreductase subunit I [Anaerolineae bacterium]